MTARHAVRRLRAQLRREGRGDLVAAVRRDRRPPGWALSDRLITSDDARHVLRAADAAGVGTVRSQADEDAWCAFHGRWR